MAVVKNTLGSQQTLTNGTGTLNSLASGTFVSCGTITFASSNKTALDVLLHVRASPSTNVSGNQQLVVYAKRSLDGTVVETGPTSGTSTTEEGHLTFIGVVSLAGSNTGGRVFSLASAFGGTLPFSAQIVVKNEAGVSLTSGQVYYQEVTGDVT